MKRRMKKIAALLVVMAMAFAVLTDAGTAGFAAGKKNAVKSVKVTNVAGKKLTLKKGQKFKLKAKVTLKKKKKATKKVKFLTGKKAVASVNQKGIVTAKKAGTAKITVVSRANPKKKVVIQVTVTDKILVKSISLNKTSLTMEALEDEYQLLASVAPKNASNRKLSWSSSNAQIADVDSTGYVEALEAGTVVITARATDGSGVKAICKVTVTDSEEDGYYDADDDDDDDYYGDDYDDDDDDYYDEEDY